MLSFACIRQGQFSPVISTHAADSDNCNSHEAPPFLMIAKKYTSS
jgi:hypothetical protein